MNNKILFVDDEENILLAFKRTLRKEYEVETAAGGKSGLMKIDSKGPYAVVVSDLRMPAMDGIAFLSRVKDISPDSVRIMLTGNAEMETAISAVNEGNIFRFLVKPCPPETLKATLKSALQQYRLITAERELLERTLKGSIKVLIDVLSLVNPAAFGRANRVKSYAKEIAASLNAPRRWRFEVAAMLSQIGCVTLPGEMMEKIYHGLELGPEEKEMYDAHPRVAKDLIANIPRLGEIAEIIEYQEKNYDGTGLPASAAAGDKIPFGARILKVSLDFDRLESKGLSKGEALAEMKKSPELYDPIVLSALETIIGANLEEEALVVKSMPVSALQAGMILAEDVHNEKGILLISRGQDISAPLRDKLINFHKSGVIGDEVKVMTKSHGEKQRAAG